MKPLKKRPELEASIQNKIRKTLELGGWYTRKTHGGKFSSGFPDLFVCHMTHGVRWIEVKRPKVGKLTRAQRKVFQAFEDHGVGVWILDAPCQIDLLFEEPNWKDWK